MGMNAASIDGLPALRFEGPEPPPEPAEPD
jgi:hypothetical protein